MSLGLSFDSKPTKVPKKVIILPEYKLNKIMRFKKYQSTEKSKKVDTQAVSFICRGVWEGTVLHRHRTPESAELPSTTFCAPCPREGASARERRIPAMEVATVNQAMSR